MAFVYKYYDQFIESEVALSLKAGEAAGARSLLIAVDSTLTQSQSETTEYIVRTSEVEVCSKYYAAVLELETRVLRFNASRGLSTPTITQLLINEIFPIISFFDGGLQLHASAVVRDEKVTCLLGHSGAGKSSLAVSLVAHGFELIDDDRILLRMENGEIKVLGNEHPLRLIHGSEGCFDLSGWQRLGVSEDGKLCLTPPYVPSSSSGSCTTLVLLQVGESFQLRQNQLLEKLLPVLECVPLSTFFSKYYGERFMRLLERIFGKLDFLSLVRPPGSDPLIIGDEISARIESMGSRTLVLDSFQRFV